jgi:hypothetical protein
LLSRKESGDLQLRPLNLNFLIPITWQRTAGALLGVFLSGGAIFAESNIGAQLRLRSTVASHTTGSRVESSSKNPVLIDVLQIQAQKSSGRLNSVLKINLATDTDLITCERRFSDTIEKKRCQAYRFPEAYIESEVALDTRLAVGLFEIPMAGWSDYLSPTERFLPSLKSDGPFEQTQAAFKIAHSAKRGTASIFITNDVTTAFPSRGEFTNRQTQPTVIAEWRAINCDYCEVIQFGNYDLNHSQYLNVGLLYKTQLTKTALDARLDFRDRKYFHARKRSFRWSIGGNIQLKLTEQVALNAAADTFRQENREIGGKIQTANRPGALDQNETRASLALAYRTPNSALQYYIEHQATGSTRYKQNFGDLQERLIQSATSMGASTVF